MIDVIKNVDDTLTVLFRGKPVGWIAPMRATRDDARLYRALSVSGHISYSKTLRGARCMLIAEAA